MDGDTGNFLNLMKTASPKRKPRTQNTSPIRNNVWPSIPPRNLTVERSGSRNAASPPPASCAHEGRELSVTKPANVASFFAAVELHTLACKDANQVNI